MAQHTVRAEQGCRGRHLHLIDVNIGEGSHGCGALSKVKFTGIGTIHSGIVSLGGCNEGNIEDVVVVIYSLPGRDLGNIGL